MNIFKTFLKITLRSKQEKKWSHFPGSASSVMQTMRLMTVSTWGVYCNCIVTCLCSLLFLFKAYAHSYRLDETKPRSPAPAQSLGALSDETLVIAPRESERERGPSPGRAFPPQQPHNVLVTPHTNVGAGKQQVCYYRPICHQNRSAGISTSCSVTCSDAQSETS